MQTALVSQYLNWVLLTSVALEYLVAFLSFRNTPLDFCIVFLFDRSRVFLVGSIVLYS